MNPKKPIITASLIVILALTGCQARPDEAYEALESELEAVQLELAETKEALSIAEEEIQRYKDEEEADLMALFGIPEIQNKEGKINAMVSSLDTLALAVENRKQEDAVYDLLENYVENQSIEIINAYYGTAGDTMIIYPETELPDGYRCTQRPFYMDAVEKGTNVAELYPDALEDRFIQTVSKAVYIDGELIGVVGIDVCLE